jgi:hypothetical protein
LLKGFFDGLINLDRFLVQALQLAYELHPGFFVGVRIVLQFFLDSIGDKLTQRNVLLRGLDLARRMMVSGISRSSS